MEAGTVPAVLVVGIEAGTEPAVLVVGIEGGTVPAALVAGIEGGTVGTGGHFVAVGIDSAGAGMAEGYCE